MGLAFFLLIIITAAVWTLGKLLPFQICPICAGVSASWLLLTALILAGYLDADKFLAPILLLMGGSVVGIAYQGEKSLAWAGRYPFLWKITVIILGMPLAFWAAQGISSAMLLGEILLLSALAYLFFIKPAGKAASAGEASDKIQDLEDKLKNCC